MPSPPAGLDGAAPASVGGEDWGDFLAVPTPRAWLEAAVTQLPTLLMDHANCEKKAAATCMALMHRYPTHGPVVRCASRFARQELRHFEQVLSWLDRLGLTYGHVSASTYAASLWREVRTGEPERLLDTLICAAFVEARSCERFAALVPVLEPVEPGLAAFYRRLQASEAGHFRAYLDLALHYAPTPEAVTARCAIYRAMDRELITRPSKRFRFHSGPPEPAHG